MRTGPSLSAPIALPRRVFPTLRTRGTSLTKFRTKRATAIQSLLCKTVLPSKTRYYRTLTQRIDNDRRTFTTQVGRGTTRLKVANARFYGPANLRSPRRISAIHSVTQLARTTLRGRAFHGLFAARQCAIPTAGYRPRKFAVRDALLDRLSNARLRDNQVLNNGANCAKRTKLYLTDLTRIGNERCVLIATKTKKGRDATPCRVRSTMAICHHIDQKS